MVDMDAHESQCCLKILTSYANLSDSSEEQPAASHSLVDAADTVVVVAAGAVEDKTEQDHQNIPADCSCTPEEEELDLMHGAENTNAAAEPFADDDARRKAPQSETRQDDGAASLEKKVHDEAPSETKEHAEEDDDEGNAAMVVAAAAAGEAAA